MGAAAVNYKLLWFLTLSLLTQAHIIHKRQAVKESSESLSSVNELLRARIAHLKARQALRKDFNDLVSRPYDDVYLRDEDKRIENMEKLLKIGNSEREDNLKTNFENSMKTSGPAELAFADDNIETSKFSENKDILTAQPVASKPFENFLKKENQNTESTVITADNKNVNKNQISDIKNSENSQTSNSENKFDVKTQKKQLEAANNGDKNSEKNSENSEKESNHLNTKKGDKQAEKPLNEQKPNKNGLENLLTEPEALKEDPSEASELENTTETLPLYTPIPVTALANVVLKKEPLPRNSTKPPLTKPNATAFPSKPPLALEITDTFGSTTPTPIADATKATERPITMSTTKPTRRPILSFSSRRPTPQRPRPPVGLRPPAWFTNLPLLPVNPLFPNFFINPFNTTTTSTTNQPQNNVGFGIFAIPWTWRPFNNITSFLTPNRILETRPPFQDEPATTAETRDLAFWNALFHRDYKAPTNAIYKDSSEAHKTTENANDSYWKPWKFLKFFSDNGDTNDVATVPANTQILHVYFPLKYPFRGKIVQTPAYQMDEENPANNEEIPVKDDINPAAAAADEPIKDDINPVAAAAAAADELIKERALDATAHKSGDTEAMSSKEKYDKKSSLMFELEMPKPVVQLFQGFMETFMPQQN